MCVCLFGLVFARARHEFMHTCVCVEKSIAFAIYDEGPPLCGTSTHMDICAHGFEHTGLLITLARSLPRAMCQLAPALCQILCEQQYFEIVFH